MQSSNGVSGGAKEWDATTPGAGAQRVIAITQLYFRLCNFHPITIVVADALCLVFGANGATKQDLAKYLALSEERVQLGLDTIPLDMQCTSLNLNTESTVEDGPASHARKLNKDGVRYFLNYKRILPFVYAHVSQILLALCTTPLPPSMPKGSVSQVPDEQLLVPALQASPRGAAIDNSKVVAHAPTPQGSMASYSLSDAIKRREASEGIFCPVCRTYYGLDEFVKSASRCMGCKTDVLRVIVEAIRDRMNAKYKRDGSVVSVPFLATRRKVEQAGASLASPSAPDSPSVRFNRNTALADANPLPEVRSCPLARDPFLVQQALAFLYLYSAPFACINDDRYVVNSEDIMTELEYEKRLEGKATVADQFRAAHRNPNTIRVRLISQREVEASMREENRKKIEKRAHLPPWLQQHHPGSGFPGRTHNAAPFDNMEEKGKVTQITPPSASANISSPQQEMGHSPLKMKEVSRKRARQVMEIDSETREDLIRDAHFVAQEFFHDDFIPVRLPLQHGSTL
ncbi:unnamed protein product [Phytomonas sp. EM1]|nr:unnamed protein product [Phytomonas sp. EM1]|eukprot:CCW62753.1 unnamed protein product [Phytomonas sp. isolate EM1]